MPNYSNPTPQPDYTNLLFESLGICGALAVVYGIVAKHPALVEAGSLYVTWSVCVLKSNKDEPSQLEKKINQNP